MPAGAPPDAEGRTDGHRRRRLAMPTFIRRPLATGAVATGLTAATAFGGLGAPANATELDPARNYWIEHYPDHTDIVIDWFAVPKAADDVEDNLPACVAASTAIGPAWLLDQIVCMNFVEDCAEMANTDPRYVGHAIRVSFYHLQNWCSVIGAG
jgi:hypothetical protein